MPNQHAGGRLCRDRQTLRVHSRSLAALAAIGVVGSLLPFSARGAEEGFDGWSGAFQVLLRGVYLEPQNHGASQSAPQLRVDGGFYGELSAAWFMTPVLSMELSLGQVSSYDSRIEGGVAINSGPVKLMPNTWTLQYDFAPQSRLRPYVGAGLHYTGLSIHAPGSEVLTIEKSQQGWVLQAGADVRIARGWFANADVRYLGGLEPSVTVKEPAYTVSSDINPLLISAGFGFRW
jgi:outer membrane protein